jgi:hypothetical protein
MSTQSDAFEAEANTKDFTFRAQAGNKPTWTPRWGFFTDEPHFDPRFKIGGQFGGWFYGVKAYGGHGQEVGGNAEAKRGPEVNAYCDFAGVLGTGIYVTGVAGTSVNNVGVYGQTGEYSVTIPTRVVAGVVGASYISMGVWGWSALSDGVAGVSNFALGVAGGSARDSGVRGVSGGFGPTVPNTSNIAGVRGTSDRQHGVVGTSNANVGVIGFSNNIGILGYTTTPGSFAGYFLGNVQVNGTLTATVKGAVVPFPDGSQRVLYCMESPEHWFEDFGAAKLKRGRTVVKLDADFAKVITRGDYRVFVTPEGNCRGLYVHRKSANTFEVRELTGGKSSIAFSYRIVGRRKDIRGHKRFAKIDMHLPLPAAPGRAPRKGTATAAELRAFVARMEKEARARRPKGAKRGRRLRALRKRA